MPGRILRLCRSIHGKSAGGISGRYRLTGILTIISTATLQEVASLVLRRISIDQMPPACGEPGNRRSAPFWEDRLYTTAGATLRFRIGDVEFRRCKPLPEVRCSTQRSISPENQDRQFAKHFALKRQQTLPDWAEAFAVLIISTGLPSTPRVPPGNEGKLLTVGDELRLPRGLTRTGLAFHLAFWVSRIERFARPPRDRLV